MDYYFYNNDAKEFREGRCAQVLIERGLAVTGGPRDFGEQLRQLAPGDTLLMYEDGAGIVAVGYVSESWNGKAYRRPVYYISGQNFAGEDREYRIAVNWFLNLSDAPVSIQEVKKRIGYQPRGAVRKIVKRRPQVESMIAELISSQQSPLPEEITDLSHEVWEGAKATITVNTYERDPRARRACIQKWGCHCQACGIVLEKTYGSLAADYIHVHHLVPLSQVGAKRPVDPAKDMRPVCPNCHAVLHRRDPPYSIAELRQKMEERTNTVA